MTRDEILDVIARWQDAFARRDPAGYANVYAESAILESPLAGSVVGRDGARRVITSFLSAFPDATLTSEPPLIDGHRVDVVSSISGTDVGGLMGLPPSGRAFRFSIVFLLDLRAGLIVRDRRIYDFTGLLVQVGVLKAKPA